MKRHRVIPTWANINTMLEQENMREIEGADDRWLVEDTESGRLVALCWDRGMADRIAVALDGAPNPEVTE